MSWLPRARQDTYVLEIRDPSEWYSKISLFYVDTFKYMDTIITIIGTVQYLIDSNRVLYCIDYDYVLYEY